MLKNKWFYIVNVITAIVASIITFHLYPHIKKVPDYIDSIIMGQNRDKYINFSELELDKNNSLSFKDRQTYVAVVISEELLIGEEKKDRDWALDFISKKTIENGYIYDRTEKRFGYTAIVFKINIRQIYDTD